MIGLLAAYWRNESYLTASGLLPSVTINYLAFENRLAMFAALRNGDCDMAAGALAFDHKRARCEASCPSPASTGVRLNTTAAALASPNSEAVAPLSKEDAALRLEVLCCLSYGLPYNGDSGVSILTVAQPQPGSLVDVIVSADVLNSGAEALTRHGQWDAPAGGPVTSQQPLARLS